MSQEQIKTISGSIYQAYTPSSQDYKENRMPRVGQKCEFEDGRCFVFCSTAVDVAAGQVVSAPAVLEETAIAAAAASGEYTVGITQASITAGAWKKGYLTVVLGTGVGYAYRIKDNTASGTADLVTVTLYDPLCTALAATDDVTIAPSRVSNVVIGTAASDGVGIAVVPSTAGTNSTTNYFWVQYKGPGFALGADATAGIGLIQGAAGVLTIADGTGYVVANCIEEGASNSVINMNFLS